VQGAARRGAPASNDNMPMHSMVFPAYDQRIKASHVFNLLDARRDFRHPRQSYILRVRNRPKPAARRSR
jgi:glycyl-tRNA synthetase alpha chain